MAAGCRYDDTMTHKPSTPELFPSISRAGGYLEGQLLVATTQITESVFHRSVLYMCSHSEEGAMGVIINRPLPDLTFRDVLKQLKIPSGAGLSNRPVYLGGPVDAGRGLVIHTPDYRHKDTLLFGDGIAATSNLQVLHDVSTGKGPEKSLLALGYAGWTAGQLEAEIEANSWISVPTTPDLIFTTADAFKWEQAASSLGVDMYKLSGHVGHA